MAADAVLPCRRLLAGGVVVGIAALVVGIAALVVGIAALVVGIAALVVGISSRGDLGDRGYPFAGRC
jgi:hypothetical protein